MFSGRGTSSGISSMFPGNSVRPFLPAAHPGSGDLLTTLCVRPVTCPLQIAAWPQKISPSVLRAQSLPSTATGHCGWLRPSLRATFFHLLVHFQLPELGFVSESGRALCTGLFPTWPCSFTYILEQRPLRTQPGPAVSPLSRSAFSCSLGPSV